MTMAGAQPAPSRLERTDQQRSHRLLATAALADTATAIDAWRRWSAEFDLDTLDGEAYWILPLLYCNLARAEFNDPERPRLAGVYKQMRMRNALSLPRLQELLGRLRQLDCDMLPGSLTSLVLTGEEEAISLDPCELLVPAKALETADSVMQAQGWKPLMPLPPLLLLPFVASARYRHDTAGDAILTWRPFGLDCPMEQDAGLWQRAGWRESGGAAIRLADPVDRLLMENAKGRWLKICVLMDRLALQLPATTPGIPTPGLAAPPDAEASLPRLAVRHWKRYRRCPATQRPPGFVRYLQTYYRYAWQPRGLRDVFLIALQRTRVRFARTA
ncbi:MAG TPA: hypothetical protein VI566_11515 [Xanthomonadales bacterium]|nr:hypothetical protein [Xanthomonadales bacterium]